MASVYTSPSYLKSKGIINLFLASLFVLPLLLYFYFFFKYSFHFDGYFHLIPVLLTVPANFYLQKTFKFFSGARGESGAKKYLEKLPNDYCVFSNLHLQYEGKECEIDLLAIGSNGIFAVEVKNHNGKISGEADSEYWEQKKTGRKGGVYTAKMKNPIKQVKRSVYILSRILEENQVRSWITPMVLLTNQPSGVDVESSVVYTSGESLVYEIESTKTRDPLDTKKISQLEKILQQEASKSSRTSFVSEVLFMKSNAIAVVLLAVVLGIYSQLPYENGRHLQPFKLEAGQNFNRK
nr:nuclease-related domain-containing protein [uncultured Anaeromusa sp.]